jgi:thioredoxin 1
MKFAIALLSAAAENLPINLSATAATIPNDVNLEGCVMSRIDVEYGLDDILKSKDKVVVLFYASWCPFSQRFLPIFERYAKDKAHSCLRVMIDDKASLCEKYSVDVVPTLILFENGKVAKRLDGVPGVGLNEKQLTNLTVLQK